MAIDLDPTTRRTLHRALSEAFPDAHIEAGNVDAAALALHRRAGDPNMQALPPQLSQLDFSGCAGQLDELSRLTGADVPDGLTAAERAVGDTTRYYWVEATHLRKHPASYLPFVGRLAMARVRLPEERPETVRTALGSIEPEDHLIATVREANQKFEHNLGYRLERLDLITPARQASLRFGAVSVLLGYKEADQAPTCYILEAGTATGQPKVLFLGKTLDATIDKSTGYKPTPFSCPDNAYTGRLHVEGDSPKQLQVKARKIINNVSQPHYLELLASFSEQTTTIKNVWAGVILAEAALIVWVRQQRGLPDGCEKKELPT
jgi:hypothetical protein